MLWGLRSLINTGNGALSGAGGGSTTTLNPSDKAALTTLSGGNLTSTRAAGGDAYANVRSTTSKTGNGKFVIKVSGVTSGNTGESGIGIANSTATLTSFLGSDVNSMGLFNDGSVWYNSSADTSLSPAPGTTTGWDCFELLTSTIVVSRSTDGTTWVSAGPVTRPTGNLFIIVGQFVAGDTATIDFAPTGWTLSGATTWD